MDNEGQQQTDWRESLPEGVRDWGEAKSAKDADGFYKQLGDIRSRVGRSLTLPNQEATPEERSAFIAKLQDKVPELVLKPSEDDVEGTNALLRSLGRPEDATGYQPPEIEGVDYNDPTVKANLESVREAAFEMGLTQKQFQAWVGKQTQTQLEMQNSAKSKLDEDHKGLLTEFGAAYDQKLSQADAAKAEFFPHLADVDIKTLDAPTIKAMLTIAERIGVEGENVGGDNSGQGAMTPAEARESAKSLRIKLKDMRQTDPTYKDSLDKLIKYEKLSRLGG